MIQPPPDPTEWHTSDWRMQRVEISGRPAFLCALTRFRQITPATLTQPAEYEIVYQPHPFALTNGVSAVLGSYGGPA